MGFMDKVKERVKSGAGMAASKAQEEYEKRQVRRELAQAYERLGERAFDLAERGELAHGELTAFVEQARTVRAKLDSVGSGSEQAAEPTPSPEASE
jgi:hypothetical protein